MAGPRLPYESTRFQSQAKDLGRWFDAFAFRIGDPAQRRVALLFTDITERKAARDALIEREAELREAQQLAGIGSWRWNQATDRVESSPELLRIFGYPEEGQMPEFQAQRGTVYPDEEWDRLNDAVKAAMEGEGPYSVDLRATRNGEPIWVIARGNAMLDNAGKVLGRHAHCAGVIKYLEQRSQVHARGWLHPAARRIRWSGLRPRTNRRQRRRHCRGHAGERL